MKKILSLPLSLLLLITLSYASDTRPYGVAEKMIKQLNLFPKDAVKVEELTSPATPKIVEKTLKFPSVMSSDNTVEELGHHAGYYSIQHSHAARMFYFFFESRNNTEDPVVIWLSGSPEAGCGSEIALYYENGPFSIADNMSLVWNNYGWDKVSNIIYVDHPTGTGFSYSSDKRDRRRNEDGVSNDLYDFLQAFFAKHPHFAENDFYITGEAYAGHYVPAFASRINQGNKKNQGIHINLKGFAIGNGDTNPAIQYSAYTDYALEMKLIQQSDYNDINKIVPQCEEAIRLCGINSNNDCLRAYSHCITIFREIMSIAGDINPYNIRKKCELDMCYDFSNMEQFLNLKTVQKALGVENVTYVSCKLSVFDALVLDSMKNLEVGIPALLQDGIKVLIYAGEYDLMCNWLGNSRWVHAMEWYGQKEFATEENIPFVVDGAQVGVLKGYGPLSFLKVYNAGHMVPMDQPKAALEMLARWTRDELHVTPTSLH